ncbi:tetratricopeptide repeat protein [Oceanicaulis sp. LC35]|uniref:tetratricopeptide repeat protein n=1 Tax=Oceanicaulis sp. LC35 TaxID=3349635 RepID=UPI003F8769EF
MLDPVRLLTIFAVIGFAPLTAEAQTPREQLCPEGYAALSDNDAEAAIAAFQDCLADQFYDWPQEAELRTRLGAAYLATARSEEALIAYNQIFALVEANDGDVDNPLIRRNRAAAYLQLDRPEDAITDLEIALARIPEDGFTAVLAGSAYLDLYRPEEAVAAFDQAVRAEPDYPSAWIGRSAAFVEMDLTELAVEDAQEAVALAPEDPGALNALCWALVKDGRAADGLATCRAASDAAPEEGSITHSLAAALEQIGETEEAHRLFALAHEQAPDDPVVTADYERVFNQTP